MRASAICVWLLASIAIPAAFADDPAGKETPGRRSDSLGDPLPEGAVARLGTARLCHPDLYYLAFAPDGTKLATVSNGGLIRIWDVGTGRQVREWSVRPPIPCQPSAFPVAFSPDGRQLTLAKSHDDSAVRVWDVETGKLLHDLPQSGFHAIPAVAYSPDGTRLAFACGKFVRVCESQSGKLLREMGAEYRHPLHLAFAADGRTLTALGWNDEARLTCRIHRWDTDSGKEEGNHVIKNEYTYASVLSPDGTVLAAPEWANGLVRLWDATTG